ncbi:major outer membrane protein [Aliarcobacter cryaerophilus]|uniref:major outer membrane protein n=1 Tax=Aliarcobacter cryaerophilus TaxID=28198 RepID=UPI0021B5623E|nr:major outer membrane protein [Aliarcobacter cryaerophilus]MCT7486498.1 major outer membrane protein [Aliarcobacter cryaerophilus]MCT7490943.1 major outer membrane protein [Aliarcobacter cryaerophilus]
MRKISKISLVAAVAVAGFSTANAQPLEEAIKNVDVSGSVVYRYDNFGQNDINGARQLDNSRSGVNNYKVGLNLSSKVNDYVKFNSRFLVADEHNGGFVGLNSGRQNVAGANANNSGSDDNANVTLSNAYFGFTAIPNTVVNIGKQGLATPYTVAVDINGNEQNGTGILALSTFGPITAGAGYFNNTNLNESFELNASRSLGYKSTNTVIGGKSILDGGADMYVATVQGDLDFVKLEAWYAGLQETFNTYTLAATSNLDLAENAKLGLEARYVNLKMNQDAANRIRTVANVNTETKNDMFRFAVDGKFSIVNARLAYTKTGKNGGLTALDQDAKNTSLGWAITSNGAADADYFQAALGADILDNLNFTLNYGKIKSKDTVKTVLHANLENYKAEEVYGQLTYKMSKNLTTYLRYGTYEQKAVDTGAKAFDQNRGRIQVAYTF